MVLPVDVLHSLPAAAAGLASRLEEAAEEEADGLDGAEVRRRSLLLLEAADALRAAAGAAAAGWKASASAFSLRMFAKEAFPPQEAAGASPLLTPSLPSLVLSYNFEKKNI